MTPLHKMAIIGTLIATCAAFYVIGNIGMPSPFGFHEEVDGDTLNVFNKMSCYLFNGCENIDGYNGYVDNDPGNFIGSSDLVYGSNINYILTDNLNNLDDSYDSYDSYNREFDYGGEQMNFEITSIQPKNMFVPIKGIINRNMFDFMLEYPCGDTLKGDFVQFSEEYAFVSGEEYKKNIVTAFLSKINDMPLKFSIYANYASHVIGCRINQKTILRSYDIYNGGYSTCNKSNLIGFTCSKYSDGRGQCITAYDIDEGSDNIQSCDYVMSNDIMCENIHFRGTTFVRSLFCIDII